MLLDIEFNSQIRQYFVFFQFHKYMYNAGVNYLENPVFWMI